MYKPEIITNAEYHGIKTHISSTGVRTFKKNKKQFEYGLTHELVKQTKAMADGTAVHSFFLERDKFDTDFVIKPADMRLNTKAGKEWALEQKDKIIRGDKQLLKKVTKDQFCGDKSKMIIARCIMNEVVNNKEWLKKNNLGVEWYE